MQTNEIKCDECGRDLTYTGNCEDYYLVLSSGSKAPWYAKDGSRGGFVTAMAIYPPVDRTYHFCGLDCMDSWRDKARAKAAAQKEWRDKNKVDHGNGWFTMPDLPPELA